MLSCACVRLCARFVVLSARWRARRMMTMLWTKTITTSPAMTITSIGRGTSPVDLSMRHCRSPHTPIASLVAPGNAKRKVLLKFNRHSSSGLPIHHAASTAAAGAPGGRCWSACPSGSEGRRVGAGRTSDGLPLLFRHDGAGTAGDRRDHRPPGAPAAAVRLKYARTPRLEPEHFYCRGFHIEKAADKERVGMPTCNRGGRKSRHAISIWPEIESK